MRVIREFDFSNGKANYLATVVEVEGSSSAALGSSAVFDESGIYSEGWIGGGCLHGEITDSIRSQGPQPHSLDIILDDDIEGLGIPCGGRVKIFINPILPSKRVEVSTNNNQLKWEALAEVLDVRFDFVNAKTATDFETELYDHFSAEQVSTLAITGADTRLNHRQVTIIGENLIAFSLSRILNLLDFEVENLSLREAPIRDGFNPSPVSAQTVEINKESVVLCSHHLNEDILISRSISNDTRYIGFVASKHRVSSLMTDNPSWLSEKTLFSPCGLRGFGKAPGEVALSIALELVKCHRQGDSSCKKENP